MHRLVKWRAAVRSLIGSCAANSGYDRAMRIPLTLLLALAIAGCAARGTAANEPAPEPPDLSCRVDTDCVVKDVGNCCGYFPACVNVDSPTFPERVRAQCAKTGTVGICGFPEISACACVEKRCAPQSDPP